MRKIRKHITTIILAVLAVIAGVYAYNYHDMKQNIVYNELLTRGFSVDVGVVRIEETDEAGKRRQKSYEIDFVVNKGAKKYYIQSALNISDDMKARQELRPLLTVNDFFKKFVITKTSMKPWVDEIGIIHLGLYDFLLNEDYFEL